MPISDVDSFRRLHHAYAKALAAGGAGDGTFVLDGQEWLVDYAYYRLEYMLQRAAVKEYATKHKLALARAPRGKC